nr:hypothetical protein [Candidatus Sigynarchaeota archaeon]
MGSYVWIIVVIAAIAIIGAIVSAVTRNKQRLAQQQTQPQGYYGGQPYPPAQGYPQGYPPQGYPVGVAPAPVYAPQPVSGPVTFQGPQPSVPATMLQPQPQPLSQPQTAQPSKPRFCSFCGAQTDGTQKFCGNCGAEL